MLADKVRIDGCAFQHCSNITQIVFGDNLKTIGNWAFQMDWLNDNNFRTKFRDLIFPASLEHIGDRAFQNINSITNLVFRHPASITNIGSTAFHRFNERYKYSFKLKNLYKLKRIKNDAFCDTYFTGFDDMMIYGIEYFGQSAGAWCGQLKKIKIPATITNVSQLGDGPFRFTSNLAEISIHVDSPLWNDIAATTLRLTNGMNNAHKCKITTYTGLCEIKKTVDGVEWVYMLDANGKTWIKWTSEGQTLPANLIVPEELDGNKIYGIMACAFNSCAGLRSVKLPATVEMVDAGAFHGCTDLEKIRVYTKSAALQAALKDEYGEELVESYQDSLVIVVR